MISYAQNYEDVILMRALGAIDKGFYIDVGAQHPVNDSVTKAFYERGWRGINIEPVDQWFKLLQQDRPEDVNLHAVVSSTAGEHVLYEVVNTGLSTSSVTFAERHKAGGHEVVRHTVPGRTLDDIIGCHAPADIHFLKIDVEGAEEDVLRSISFDRHRPWILVIEATEPNSQSPAHEGWEPIVLAARYVLVYEDGLNRFYLAEEHSELKEAFRFPPNYFDSFMPYAEWWARGQLDARERELNEARRVSQLASLSERAGRAEAMVAALQSEVERAEREILDLRNKAMVLEQECAAKPEQIRTLGKEIAEAHIKLGEMARLEAKVVELEGEKQSLRWALRESQARAERLRMRIVSGRALRLELTRRVRMLRDEVERAVRANAGHESERDALREQLRQTDNERQGLLRQVQTLIESVAELEAEKKRLETALASMRDEAAIERNARRENEERLAAALDQVARLTHEQAQLQQGLRMREQEIEELLAQLGQVLGSRSWRLTAPLRAVRRMPGVAWRKVLGVGSVILHVIARIPGARAVGRRLLVGHPAVKERLVRIMLRRSVEIPGEAGQVAEKAPVPSQPAVALSRSAREALVLIKRYRNQDR